MRNILKKKRKKVNEELSSKMKDFIYHEEEDRYECPVMHYSLEFQRIEKDSKDIEYREYWTNKCKNMPSS